MNEKKQNTFEPGRVPPCAVDLEEIVLGALMLDKECLEVIVPQLKPVVFYKDAHNIIFSAIKILFERRDPIDILTVTNYLKTTGELQIVGGAYYISQLTNRIASTANIDFHTKIILQKYFQRQIIMTCTEAIRESYNDGEDVFNTLNKVNVGLDIIQESLRTGKSIDEIKDLIELSEKGYYDRKEARKNHIFTGVDTGIMSLNEFTGGWQNSDVIVIAARPAMGKTALACLFAFQAALSGKKVLFDSQEMSGLQLANRLLLFASGLNAKGFNEGTFSGEDEVILSEAKAKLKKLGIYIDDTPSTSVDHTRYRARKLKKSVGLDLIVSDYIQLKTTEKEFYNREQQVAEISRKFKGMAREIDIPCIVLAQLSRAVESRGGDKRPQLSDLRESGAIEQDADLVIFPHRPEYYNLTEDAGGNSTAGLMELIIAKHRNGPVTKEGDIVCKANISLTSIKDHREQNSFFTPPDLFIESNKNFLDENR